MISKQFLLLQINFNRPIKIYVIKNCDDISGLNATADEIEDPSNEYINEQWVVSTYAFTRVIKLPRLF